jgi:hypothetical protein
MEPLEPVCQICAEPFSSSKVPYLLSCHHLLCSTCCNRLEDRCLVKDCQAMLDFQKTLPALDLLDVIIQTQTLKKRVGPQTWANLDRKKLRCRFTLQGRTCQYPVNMCPFSHVLLPDLRHDTWECSCGQIAIGYYCQCGFIRLDKA